MSDLHLEVGLQYSTFEIPSCAPNLILAGDIGRLSNYDLFADFLEAQCTNFQQVFLVLGNHEFYGISRANGLKLAVQLENESRFNRRLRILNRTRIELAENVTLLGCTLQSFITPGCEQIVKSKIQDFRRIVDWTIADHNDEHKTDVKWLKASIEQIGANTHGNHRIIVITHHAPVRRGSSSPEYERNPWTDAFATELLDDSENQEANPLQAVTCWIFGHTHFSTEFCRGRVRIISNQRGYDLGRNRCQKGTENLKKEDPESRSELPLLKKLLGSIWVRQRSNTRQQALLSTQTGMQPLPCQKLFDVRKCIEI